ALPICGAVLHDDEHPRGDPGHRVRGGAGRVQQRVRPGAAQVEQHEVVDQAVQRLAPLELGDEVGRAGAVDGHEPGHQVHSRVPGGDDLVQQRVLRDAAHADQVVHAPALRVQVQVVDRGGGAGHVAVDDQDGVAAGDL